MDDVLVKCPNCGIKDLDLRAYASMMVLSNTQALFTVYCNHCNQTVSTVANIPSVLFPDVYQAAAEVVLAWDARSNSILCPDRAFGSCSQTMTIPGITFNAPFNW